LSGDLDKIPKDSTVHIIDFDGTGASKYIDVHDIDNLGVTINTIAELLVATGKWTDVSGLMWKGLWLDGTYHSGDLVRDGVWTMTPIVPTTTDRPAPQEIGSVQQSVALDSVFSQTNNMSLIKMQHDFTITKAGYFKGVRIKVPIYTIDLTNTIYIKHITSGESTILATNATLLSDVWSTISNEAMLVRVGDVIEVGLVLENIDSSNSITGNWTSNRGGGDPAPQQFIVDDFGTPTTLKISHTDLDSGARGTELDNIPVGSAISLRETGDSTRSVTVRVLTADLTPITATDNTVSVIASGDKEVRDNKECAITSNAGGLSATEYYHLTDHYPTNNPSFATITTKLFYDGVEQADTDDAYGINILFQEASMSADWDLVSYSGGSSDSGSSVSAGVEEAPIDGNPYVRVNGEWWIATSIIAVPPFDASDTVGGSPGDTVFDREIDCGIQIRDDVDLDFEGGTPSAV